MEEGPKWVQDESELHQQSLKEQLEQLESGWKDLLVLWEKRKRQLIQALNHQVSTCNMFFQCWYTYIIVNNLNWLKRQTSWLYTKHDQEIIY